jgi:hypothetical protein
MTTPTDPPASHAIGPKPLGTGCRFCIGRDLRRSRLRRTDWPKLLLLQWPVRCLRCSKRQFVPWTESREALPSRTPHAPERREQESWQNYTSAEQQVLRSDPRSEDDL